MYQLENWRLDIGSRFRPVGWISGAPIVTEVPVNPEHIHAWGDVSGHPRFTDGTDIHTSRIVKFEMDEAEERFLMDTRSGSHYELKFGEVNVDAFEKTVSYLQQLGASEEVIDRCRILSRERDIQRRREKEEIAERRRQEAETKLGEGELYLVITEWNRYAYYKESASTVREIPVRVHVGTFGDSYLVLDGKVDFRFFQNWDTIRSYSMNGIGAIWLKNECEDELRFEAGENIVSCKPKEATLVSDDLPEKI